MTKQAHTPGPWKAVNNAAGTAFEIWNDDSQWVAYVWPQEPEVEHANAALIAAAPDLLAALRALTDLHCDWEVGGMARKSLVERNNELITAARAAIAKATGEQ